MPALSTLRLVGSTGANRAMEAELKRLSRRALPELRLEAPRRWDEQTLSYAFDPALAWLTVHYLRTPARVLWDAFEARAERLEPLYEEISEWVASDPPRWLHSGRTLSVRAKDIGRFPASTTQIQGTVKNALIDGAKRRGLELSLDPNAPDILLSVRGSTGPLVISLDLSGRSMHERGYRIEAGDAPLKETTAAQMLMLARWDSRSEVLIDPLCGAGTIAIEAAGLARADPIWIPPRGPAPYATSFLEARELTPLFPDATPVILGNELHTKVVDQARRNVERAGASDRVQILHGDFRNLSRKRLLKAVQDSGQDLSLDRGLIVSNPPFGERLDDTELETLYRDLRDFAFSFGAGWRAAFLSANPDLERIFGRRPILKKPMPSGRLKSYLLVYDLASE